MLNGLFRVNTRLFFRRDGKMVILKEVDSDIETQRYIKNRVKYPKNKKRLNVKKDVSNMENSTVEGAKDKILKPRFPRKRTYKKAKVEEENNLSNVEVQVSTSTYIEFCKIAIFSINDSLRI